MNRSRFLVTLNVFFFAFASMFAVSEEEKNGNDAPGELIASVTTELLETVKTKQGVLSSDPNAYFAEIRAQLEPVIDFESIAKNVMGKKAWLSVDNKQRAKFINAFTESLVSTYGKAMGSFADLEVKVVKTWPSENPAKKNHYVQQDVKLEGGLAHIVYNMYPVDDVWKVRNVIIRDNKGYQLNMGKTFYKQFQHALEENGGDVASTIAKWGEQ